MNPLAIAVRIAGGRARRGGKLALYLTVGTTSVRLVRRVMSTKQKTLLRFEVKPGEVYEIRGVRRGR